MEESTDREVIEDAGVEEVVEDAVEETTDETTEDLAEAEETPSESSTDTRTPEEIQEELIEKRAQEKANKKIAKQTRRQRDAERERDYWRKRAETPVPQQEPLKTLEDFDYDEAKYEAYKFERTAKLATEAAKRELLEEQRLAEYKKRVETFESNEDKFAREKEDYYDVTRSEDLAISLPMRDIIESMDDGPAVLYHLGENPDISAGIAKLPPIEAAREMGRIQAKLEYAEELRKRETKKVTDAPNPAKKIDTTSPGTPKRLTELVDQKAFEKRRRNYIANRR